MKPIFLGQTALVAFVGLLATADISANATTLPDYTSIVTVIDNDPTTTITTDPSSVTEPNASGSIATLPAVNIQTTSTALGTDYLGGQSATAYLTYYFSAIGGVVGTPVTVDVLTNLMTAASTEPAPGSIAFYGFSEIDVGPTLEETVCTDTTQCAASQFNGTLQLTVDSGDVVQVHFEVISESDTAFAGTASASADPMLSIDSSTLNAGLYCIQVSAGVGGGSCGVSATPLPATLPLFAGGLGFVGYLARRRKQKAKQSLAAA
jgi:hypothetical protein